MGALDAAVRQGKALYVGVSSYSAERTAEAAAILRGLGTPLLIHQPSYSMLNRWIEPDLLDSVGDLGVGCIGFSPLAQGMLTDKYLDGIPEGSRASRPTTLSPVLLTWQTLDKVRALREIAAARGQNLAQMALTWTLRDARMTSTLIGASSVEQLEMNVAAIDRLDFTPDELTRSTATPPTATSTFGLDRASREPHGLKCGYRLPTSRRLRLPSRTSAKSLPHPGSSPMNTSAGVSGGRCAFLLRVRAREGRWGRSRATPAREWVLPRVRARAREDGRRLRPDRSSRIQARTFLVVDGGA
jgi:Aldo/keto reductase family